MEKSTQQGGPLQVQMLGLEPFSQLASRRKI